MRPFGEQMEIEVGERRRETVRIGELDFGAVGETETKTVIAERNQIVVEHPFKEPSVVQPFHRRHASGFDDPSFNRAGH